MRMMLEHWVRPPLIGQTHRSAQSLSCCSSSRHGLLPAHERRVFGCLDHPETTPPSIPTKSRTAAAVQLETDRSQLSAPDDFAWWASFLAGLKRI